MALTNTEAVRGLEEAAFRTGNLSAGVVTQPSYQYNAGGTVTLGAGTYSFYREASYQGGRDVLDVTGDTLAITDKVTTYIICSYNAGSPALTTTTDITSVDDGTSPVVYTVYRDGDNFSVIDWNTPGEALSNKIHRRLVETERFSRVYGFNISEYGTRNLTVTAGKAWQGSFPNSVVEANSVDDTFILWVNNGDGTFSWSQQTQYNNTQYDPKTGSLADYAIDEYGVIWLYRDMSSGSHDVHMILGNAGYDLNGAKAAQPVEVPQFFDTNTLLIGKVIVLSGAATATEIDSAFESTFAGSVTTNHSGLTGLTGGHAGDYDHLPLYTDDDTTAMIETDRTTGVVTIPSLVNGQLDRLLSSTVVSGMELSINADTSKFDVAAGVYEVVDNFTDPENPTKTTVAYAGSTANTITNLATANVSYISINSSGTLIQSTEPPVGETLRDYPEIGVITHPNKTSITSVDSRTTTPPIAVAASVADMSVSLGIINASGNVYSPNGANLKLNKSSGTSFAAGINSSTSKKNPNITTDAAAAATSFVYEWRDGAGGTKTYISDTIQPAWYDDNTTGGAAEHPNGTVSSNKWTIMPIRYYPASGYTVIDAGQALYNSEAEAEAAIKDAVETIAVASGSIRAWLLVRGAATDLSDPSDASIILAGKFGEGAIGAGTGVSTTTLQQAYDNSSEPEVLTDATRGALSVKRGSAADTDNVLEVQNGVGSVTAAVTGNGNVIAASFGTKFMKVSDGTFETAVEGTEYYSPDQHGGIYGTVYRQYHGTKTNGQTITATGITKLIGYGGIFNGDVCYNGHTADDSSRLYLKRITNGAQVYLVTWTLNEGWIEYVK